MFKIGPKRFALLERIHEEKGINQLPKPNLIPMLISKKLVFKDETGKYVLSYFGKEILSQELMKRQICR